MAFVSIGKVSSRGQVAIPTDLRERMDLHEGEEVLFLLEDDRLIVKKINSIPWSELTKSLHATGKKIREEDVADLIHKMRKESKK